MNRLTTLFDRKKNGILSVFYTAGFPRRDDTAQIAQHLESAGADLIEIGIPFSDPVADGPVIQHSNTVALQNGMTVKLLLEQVSELRRSVQFPVILMGYLNPVLQYGLDKFIEDAKGAGVDGLILPDLPLDEFDQTYRSSISGSGLSISFLVSPTTSQERIRRIDSASSGFVYAVSASSTTGSRGEFTKEQVTYFETLQKEKLRNPFLIGFGISTRATFSRACEYGAGAIVGSAFIERLQSSTDHARAINDFVAGLRG